GGGGAGAVPARRAGARRGAGTGTGTSTGTGRTGRRQGGEPMSALRIATRGSKLALWQAEHVRALLCAEEPGLEVELLVLKTTGDRVQDRPLFEIGGKGLFTKEIEEALLDRRAELAVHSLKDLPAD